MPGTRAECQPSGRLQRLQGCPLAVRSFTITHLRHIRQRSCPLSNQTGTMCLPARLRLSILLYVDGALVRERPEPKDPVIAAHAALIDATERQLVLQVMREEPVDRHTAR